MAFKIFIQNKLFFYTNTFSIQTKLSIITEQPQNPLKIILYRLKVLTKKNNKFPTHFNHSILNLNILSTFISISFSTPTTAIDPMLSHRLSLLYYTSSHLSIPRRFHFVDRMSKKKGKIIFQ